MVCNAACMAAETSCLRVTGTVAGSGGVGGVVGWRGLGQCDKGGKHSSRPVPWRKG